MADFTKDLGRFVNMAKAEPASVRIPRILDKTGLPGIYEFKLESMATMMLRNPGCARGSAVQGSLARLRSLQLWKSN